MLQRVCRKRKPSTPLMRLQVDANTVEDNIAGPQKTKSELLYDPTDVGNLISGSSTFSKCSLNT